MVGADSKSCQDTCTPVTKTAELETMNGNESGNKPEDEGRHPWM